MAGVPEQGDIHSSWNDYPELLAELDLSKNGSLTFRGKPIKAFELSIGTNKILDWKCSVCSNLWSATGDSRKNRGRGCGYCSSGFLHSDGRNSMAKTHPELAKEYQGDASLIIAGTHNPLDWKCSVCEHQWSVSGNRRKIGGTGCGVCNTGPVSYTHLTLPTKA